MLATISEPENGRCTGMTIMMNDVLAEYDYLHGILVVEDGALNGKGESRLDQTNHEPYNDPGSYGHRSGAVVWIGCRRQP